MCGQFTPAMFDLLVRRAKEQSAEAIVISGPYFNWKPSKDASDEETDAHKKAVLARLSKVAEFLHRDPKKFVCVVNFRNYGATTQIGIPGKTKHNVINKARYLHKLKKETDNPFINCMKKLVNLKGEFPDEDFSAAAEFLSNYHQVLLDWAKDFTEGELDHDKFTRWLANRLDRPDFFKSGEKRECAREMSVPEPCLDRFVQLCGRDLSTLATFNNLVGNPYCTTDACNFVQATMQDHNLGDNKLTLIAIWDRWVAGGATPEEIERIKTWSELYMDAENDDWMVAYVLRKYNPNARIYIQATQAVIDELTRQGLKQRRFGEFMCIPDPDSKNEEKVLALLQDIPIYKWLEDEDLRQRYEELSAAAADEDPEQDSRKRSAESSPAADGQPRSKSPRNDDE